MDTNTNSQNPENQNSDNLVIPQPPAVQPAVVWGSRSRKIVSYIVILVLILAILGVAVYFFVKNGKTKIAQKTAPPEQSQAVKDAILASQETGAMLTLSPIVFPKIASQTTIPLAQIPKDLAGLILPDVKGLQTLQVTLNNQKTGFRIIYSIPEPVRDAHGKYVPLTGWKKLKAAVSNFAGIVILEDQTFQAECIETYLDTSHTRVSILAVKK